MLTMGLCLYEGLAESQTNTRPKRPKKVQMMFWGYTEILSLQVSLSWLAEPIGTLPYPKPLNSKPLLDASHSLCSAKLERSARCTFGSFSFPYRERNIEAVIYRIQGFVGYTVVGVCIWPIRLCNKGWWSLRVRILILDLDTRRPQHSAPNDPVFMYLYSRYLSLKRVSIQVRPKYILQGYMEPQGNLQTSERPTISPEP